jgi:quinol-cytochrome oxidoreductase complex cytochrome b subunit
MNSFVLGLTLKTLGEVIIGFAVISVHLRIIKEHKLDRKVYRSIRNEKFWGSIGVLFVIAGYIIEVASYTSGGLS